MTAFSARHITGEALHQRIASFDMSPRAASRNSMMTIKETLADAAARASASALNS